MQTRPPLVYGAVVAGLLSGLVSASAQPPPAQPPAELLPGLPLPPPIRAEGGHRPQARKLPDGRIILRNPHLAAVVVKGERGYRALAVYPAPRPGTESEVPAAVAALGQLTAGDASAAPVEVGGTDAVLRGDHQVVLTGTTEAGGTSWLVTTTLTIENQPWVSWEVSARPTGAGRLARLVPLSLRAGETGPREVLFPGIAHLEGFDTVSGPLVPDPLRITVPLMVQSQGRVSAGLFWNPRQVWGGSGLPGALLEPSVPERTTAATRMELFVPAAGAPPVALAAGQEVRVAGKLFLRSEAERPALAVRRWLEAYPSTAPISYPRSLAAARQVSRAAFTSSLWVPGAPGWKFSSGAADALPYSFGVQALLLDAAQAESPAVRADLRRQAEQVLAALRKQGPLPTELAYRDGGVPESLETERDHVISLIREQLPDGGWAAGAGSSLPVSAGQPGVLDPALVAGHAVQVLRFAALTGDSAAAGAGRRAADLLLAVRVPRPTGYGAAPTADPELATVATLAECFLLTYQVTGERDYLDPARQWANTGLSYLYLWAEPSRPAQQFASVSRFPNSTGQGPVLASQADGLEFARVLLLLDRVRPDDVFTRAAAGVLASAMRQQSTSGADAGLLPEHWDIREGRGTGEKLNPWPLLQVLYQLEGPEPGVSHVRTRAGADRMFVASGATIEDAYTTTMRLRLKLRGLRGQSTLVTVTGVTALPLRVEYNSDSLLPFGIVPQRRFLPESTGGTEPGWFYDLETGFLMIRLDPSGDDDHLEIRWPDPRERVRVNRVDRSVEPRR